MRLLVKVDNTGTGMYYHRVRTPFEHLGYNYAARVEEAGVEQKIRHLAPHDLKQYDAVVFSRQIELDGTSEGTIKHIKNSGLKVVFDIDDYWQVEGNHYLSQAYKKYSVSEQTLTCLREADIVFTPTPYLTEAVRKHNKETYTIKTCVDTSHAQWKTKTVSSDLMRFGWIGGIHHLNDVKILEKSFNKVHRNLTGHQLCLGGFSAQAYCPNPVTMPHVKSVSNLEYVEIEKIFTSNYKATDHHYNDFLQQYNRSLPDHIWQFKNYKRMWDKSITEYGTLYDQIDVSLVPLANTGMFNQYKSELKLIEAGTKGKMAIVSRVKPYDLIPEECVHFIEPGDTSGWYKAIKYCLENRNYVKDKAAMLYEHIKEHYDLQRENQKRYDLIKNTINK